MFSVICRIAFVLVCLMGVWKAHAISGYEEEYKRVGAARTIASYGPDLFGDQVSLYDGSLSFKQTDLSVPGNDALPLALTRTRAINDFTFPDWHFGDWMLDIPRVHGIFGRGGWTVPGSPAGARCSRFQPPPQARYLHGQLFTADDYWHGVFLSVPGHGQQEIVKRSTSNTRAPAGGTATWTLVTAAGWQLKCLTLPGNTVNESFIAVSPQGLTYVFGHSMVIPASPLDGGGLPRPGGTLTPAAGQRLPPSAYFPRNEIWHVVTSVTDRFGNSLTYNYDPVNTSRLTSMVASDGRQVTFTYDPSKTRRITKVSHGTREWNYAYNASGHLTSVTLPDGSSWGFNLGGFTNGLQYGSVPTCDSPGAAFPGAVTGTIQHPSGATGRFKLSTVVHTRSKVWRQCLPLYDDPTLGYTKAKYPRYFGTLALEEKEITGPGLSGLLWAYSYSNSSASWSTCTSGCGGTKTVTVTESSGAVVNRRTRHTFGTVWQVDEGQLLRLDEGWDPDTGTALRTTESVYQRWAPGQNFMQRVGEGISPGDRFRAENLTPLKRKTITQQGVSFVWEAADFDIFGRPFGTTHTRSSGGSKNELLLYHDLDSQWVLGQLGTRTVDGVQAERVEYFGANALPQHRYVFGRRDASYTYHTNGLRATVSDGLNQTTTYTNHKRGIAQNIAYADGTSVSATVDDLGLIRSIVNEAGKQTGFDYDPMGRLSRIFYPAESWGGYHETWLSFTPMAAPNAGLAAGHWKQTETTGNRRTERYFDAMWRMRLERTWDQAPGSARSMAALFDYDADGKKTRESYPKTAISSIYEAAAGHRWTHDALGRETLHEQDSELVPSVLNTTTAYLAGFQKQVTNPRGYVTTFGFQAFDQPSEESISSIGLPLNVWVTIPRDVFGKALSITRAGVGASVTRSYVYDANERLCKTVEPETGATIQQYDAASNLVWRASGQAYTVTSPGICDQGSVGHGSKINFGYDSRNRLTSTGFGDGQPGISRSYTPDGLLQQTISSSFTWTYVYNNRRLLTQEQFSVPGQAPGAGWNFTWGIEGHGNVSSLSDPWGTMNYAPNALGEPTQVSGYASGVSYHANGAVAGYTLVNGVVRSVGLNTRGLPAQWQDAGVVNDAYSYDANGNVTGIQDVLQGVNTRSMGYDGLDRLVAANGPWGGGQFSYDALDNLIYSELGGRALTHHISPANNRLTSLSGSQSVLMDYNANGNLVLRGAQGYSFDIANRMRSAWGKATYDYDGHGRRSWVVFADSSTQLNAYSGTGAAGKLRFSGHSVKGNTRYVYLGDKLIAEANSLTGTSFSHTDALGSPVARTNGSGAVTERTRYEPYGGAVAGSTNPVSIGFTGHVNDADTGLVYMQQRYYDPVAGRFLSVDPVTTDSATGDSFNRYVYALNNPYKFGDPDGRFAILLLIPPALEAAAAWIVATVTPTVVATAAVAAGVAVVATSNSDSGKQDGAAGSGPSVAGGQTSEARRSPSIRCVNRNCGAWHGGAKGAYCPSCDTKSKDPKGQVPPNPKPEDKKDSEKGDSKGSEKSESEKPPAPKKNEEKPSS